MENKFGVVRLNYWGLLLFLLLLDCQSREILPKGTGAEYFPLKKGMYWIYHIQETNITPASGQTNSSYDLKVEVTDSVLLSGQWYYLMVRSTRTDPAGSWSVAETWSARKNQYQLIVQEGNTPFVTLAFPLTDGKQWNGNAMNNLGNRCDDGTMHCDIYVATDLAKRFEGNNQFFDDTVTILENNYVDTLTYVDVRKSVYAKSVGLIYREVTIESYCIPTPQVPCPSKQFVDTGHILKQTLTDYGAL